MAVKRFRKYGKKRRGMRRRANRRISRPMVLRPRNNHYFSRYGFYGSRTLTTNANGQFFGACYTEGIRQCFNTLTVVGMPNYTEFVALFDQYKVLSFTYEFIPRYLGQDLITTTGLASSYLPTIYWYFDQDDGNAPTDMDEVMQHQKVRKAVLSRPISITVKYPCVAQEIYRSSTTTGYGSKRSPWLDLAYDNIPHYGFKFAVQGQPTFSYTLDVRVKWRLAFKTPR